MTSDFRLIETACIHCLYKPVFGTELGKSSSAAFNSQTTSPKLVFADCWDLANPNTRWLANQCQVSDHPTDAIARLSVHAWARNRAVMTLIPLQCRPRATPTRSVTQWRIHPGLMLMVQYCSWKLRGRVARDEFLRMRKPKSPETALHCKSRKNSNLSAKLPFPRDTM
jgi:hypothetical protein